MFNILVVEDNPDDAFLVKEAFKDNPSVGNLHVVGSGDDALAFLRQKGDFAGSRRPDLVLLDLNLPGTNGREVLKGIKGDDSLKSIPVVILTSSQSDEDRRACYELHANAFMTKALDFDELQRMARMISDYWFGLVKLPPH